MKAICAKARKLPKQTAELKDDLEAFEAKLDADAAEVAEEHAAARAARKQVSIQNHFHDVPLQAMPRHSSLGRGHMSCVSCFMRTGIAQRNPADSTSLQTFGSCIVQMYRGLSFLQAGCSDDDEDEEAEGEAAEPAGDEAVRSMAASADVAAVEGLLSGLALSDAGAESAAAVAPVPDAAAQPDQATAPASGDAISSEASAPAVEGGGQEALTPAAAEDSAEAARGEEPDLAAVNAQDKLVQEAEQQLAQLQLGAGDSAQSAEAPLSEQQQSAEEPQADGAAADSTAGVVRAHKAARQEDTLASKSAKSTRGSLTKKVPILTSHYK